jgi:hypothetical protein
MKQEETEILRKAFGPKHIREAAKLRTGPSSSSSLD